MHILPLLALAASAEPPPSTETATLVVDSKVPAEVLVDGQKLAQLWAPGEVAFQIIPGAHALRLYTNGDASDFPLVLAAGGEVRVMVGRTGISLDDSADPTAASDDEAQTVPVEFRTMGRGVQLRLDRQRITLTEGERKSVELAPGNHRLSVRSQDGTVIWANGTLEVQRGASLVVQVAEGRMPELSGSGRFHAGGG
ncbi:MAG: hypothetical protein KTR31_14145 [Myxococcales bacterium]|nr:hypothetical protein [Myxococcales bacterium]